MKWSIQMIQMQLMKEVWSKVFSFDSIDALMVLTHFKLKTYGKQSITDYLTDSQTNWQTENRPTDQPTNRPTEIDSLKCFYALILILYGFRIILEQNQPENLKPYGPTNELTVRPTNGLTDRPTDERSVDPTNRPTQQLIEMRGRIKNGLKSFFLSFTAIQMWLIAIDFELLQSSDWLLVCFYMMDYHLDHPDWHKWHFFRKLLTVVFMGHSRTYLWVKSRKNY